MSLQDEGVTKMIRGYLFAGWLGVVAVVFLSQTSCSMPLTGTLEGSGSVNRPFPQHETYADGTIRPTNFTQAEQDQHVRDFYDYWKSSYLVSAGSNEAGKQMYRVSFGSREPDATVSEGLGYGMVTVALMAGHDPDAQAVFDGLWYFARESPSRIDSRLMSWKIKNGSAVGGNNSAFDGDVDIAYGLLLAEAQWRSSGEAAEINYKAEADQVIAGILDSMIGESSRLPMLGDWVRDNGSPYNQYAPRSSDFMPSHFRAFGRATNDATWETVISNSQAVIDQIQAHHSPTTGLLPDFIINCKPISSCAPAYSGFLEGEHDGLYYYNAGRDPWRMGLDGLLNGDATSKAQVLKMVNWVKGNSGGEASKIKAGYQLDGTPIGDYLTSFFVAPFGVGAMLDASQQDFLNDIYASLHNKHEDYYEDSVNMLTLLVMTGNYWDPTANDTPTASTLAEATATSTPTANDTPTATTVAGATATSTPTPIDTPTATTVAEASATSPPASQAGNLDKVIVGYYPAWGIYGRNYFVTDIPADKLTHINYAFANVSSAGECVLGDPSADTQYSYPGDSASDPLRGNFNQLNLLKEQHPHLKTLISVGGWSWSGHFSDAALTAASRQQFAESCVALMKEYGFDGIDIDWEYPVNGGLPGNSTRPEDKQTYTLLLAELRAQLDAQEAQDGAPRKPSDHYLLTIAAPAGPSAYVNFELDQIHQHLDWINLMSYDFHGSWENQTNFNAPLYAPADDPSSNQLNVNAAVQAYLAAGVPSQKLVMGVPSYGRGWSGVPNLNHGLYQSSTGIPPGTWEAGNFDYQDLKDNYLNRYTRYWNDEAKVPWLYNSKTGIMITYDDPESFAHKVDYIHHHTLAGAIFWELSGDDAQNSLLNTLYRGLIE
ncbi:MAG: glycosyl hydrolase family 8 [Ardenticatenaceae bacterium]